MRKERCQFTITWMLVTVNSVYTTQTPNHTLGYHTVRHLLHTYPRSPDRRVERMVLSRAMGTVLVARWGHRRHENLHRRHVYLPSSRSPDRRGRHRCYCWCRTVGTVLVARWGHRRHREERTPATWEKWAPVTFATHIPSVSSTTLIPSVS